MLKYFFLILLWLPVSVLAAPVGWRPLLEPEVLASILSESPEVRVLQVSGNFSRGHIPGAIDSPYALWRGPQDNPGKLHDLATFTSLVQEMGINSLTPVAVVHEGSNAADMGAATRVYWTLKTLGVQDVTVINGGLRAWLDAGLPVSTETTPVQRSAYVPQWQEQWRVTTAEVELLVNEGAAQLIDARPPSFFRGFRATVGRPGTIHGAENLTYESWFDGDRLKPVNELASIFTTFGPVSAPVTVSFCNTGHWASINWFVMSELLQIDNARLYAESIAEWSNADRPMDNQPNRSAIYREMTVNWFKSLFDS